MAAQSQSEKVQTIFTPEAPLPIGPYSQGKVVDSSAKMVYFSGSIAIDPATKKMIDGDISAQTELVMKHIGNLLKAAGADYSNVVKTTIYLINLGDFGKMNEVYGRFFKENPPARVCIEAKALPLGALIEIETIAAI